jgi:NAD(P)-dependent dehydrogenase (short-subunit alcohol dehydrogenase family)
MPDSDEWLGRLRVVGIDLRDPAQVVALADEVGKDPLDILINNACQTVRRSPHAYAPLIAAEAEAPSGNLPEMITFGHYTGESPAAKAIEHQITVEDVTRLALVAGSTTIDAGGLVPDLAPSNSWVQAVDEVDAIELLEVQLCNVTAPFILVSRLRAAMRKAEGRRRHIVNVSAMEGVFSRGYKGPGHPHTNMAKAALNMLTRTSAREIFETDQILMNSVDTGWITDERPHPTKMRLAGAGFHAPLDLSDGAARVYDPIVRGEGGEDVYGCFLKDYRKSQW